MVKWPQSSEDTSLRVEGRTSKEAVRLARIEFGVDAPVRCWKARRGGLFGFFAKEVYVAGIEAPVETRDAQRTSSSAPTISRSVNTTWTNPRVADGNGEWLLSNDMNSLAELVESTHDEVTLGKVSGLESAFNDVLAQAQAALSAELHDTSPALPEEMHQPPLIDCDIAPVPLARPAPPTPFSLLESLAPSQLANLPSLVSDLGVPRKYWPEEPDCSLDGLVRSFTKLPVARPVPRNTGTVIVVLGARRDARTTAVRLVELMGLDASDLIEAECTSASRQRVNRRRSSRVSIVTVDSSLRSKGLALATKWIEQIRPDYIVGAVSATAKKADVEHWRRQLPQFDALALSKVAETSSPGELLGELPILLLDGAPATALHWVALVLSAYLESQ